MLIQILGFIVISNFSKEKNKYLKTGFVVVIIFNKINLNNKINLFSRPQNLNLDENFPINKNKSGSIRFFFIK